MCSILTAFAEQIKVPDIALPQGGSATVEILLSNEHANLVAFQMDVTLPEGIGIDKTGCKLSSRIADREQNLVIGKLESGAFRLTSTSMSLTPISGTEGTLLILKLYAEENFVKGQAHIVNIYFATSESERIKVDDVSFIIKKNTTSISEMILAKPQDVQIYSPNGKKLNKLQKGLNIIRMSNGKTQKVVVK